MFRNLTSQSTAECENDRHFVVMVVDRAREEGGQHALRHKVSRQLPPLSLMVVTPLFSLSPYYILQAGGACFARPLLHPICISHCALYTCMHSIKCCKQAVKGQTLQPWRGHGRVKERMHVGHWLCKQHSHEVAMWRMRIYIILHPVRARDLINQLAKKFRNSLVLSPSLLRDVWRQDARNRIYYLCDDDCDNIFPWIKLLS